MRKTLFYIRWDQVVTKDIESFQRKAIINYKSKVQQLKSPLDQEELIKNLYDIRYDSLLIFNKCEQLNPEITSNSSYNSIFGNAKRKLLDDFSSEESNIIDKNLATCRKYINSFIKAL